MSHPDISFHPTEKVPGDCAFAFGHLQENRRPTEFAG
jgi:hypothetical protein